MVAEAVSRDADAGCCVVESVLLWVEGGIGLSEEVALLAGVLGLLVAEGLVSLRGVSADRWAFPCFGGAEAEGGRMG